MNTTNPEPSAHHEWQTPAAQVAKNAFDDPVIAAYASGIDRTLLRENLKLTVDEQAPRSRFVLVRSADPLASPSLVWYAIRFGVACRNRPKIRQKTRPGAFHV